MAISISKTISAIPDFYVLSVDKIANDSIKNGNDIIKLNLGKSEVNMHESVIDTFKQKVSDPISSNIVDSQGLPELREGIVSYYKKMHKVNFSPKQVFINNGTSPLLLSLFHVLINEGDTILLPRPYYPSYNAIADMLHAKKEFYNISNGKIDLKDFENKFDPEKTKIVVINSPGNPLGNVLNKQELKNILGIINGHAFVLSDEIYDELQEQGFSEEEI